MFVDVVVVAIVVLCALSECIAQNKPEVETPLGKVRGYYRTSYEGKTFSAFQGIPYAKPPVGNLRFERPQVIEPWTGILEANQGRKCIQIIKAAGSGHTDGEEDCLYINVYTPSETPNSDDNLDVVVYIHGGGFIFGSGLEALPELVMDKGLLMVTFNYRLGALGFLCTMDETVSCNNGMKDQVMALKWIQENIESFGGNPKSVTITGLSAGAASVHYHYVSPLSKGLFHRGFSMSGTTLNPWTYQQTPVENANVIARHVGCDNSNVTLIECLKNSKDFELVDGLWDLYAFLWFPITPFAPTLEPESDYVFLPDHPYKLLANGSINDVPWLTSSTHDEGMSYVLTTNLYKNLDTLNERWDEIVPHMLDTSSITADEDKQLVPQKIKEHYFGNNSVTSNDLGALAKLFTDREFAGGLQRASLLQAKFSKSPIYDLIFAYIGEYTCTNNYEAETHLKGVCHADDMRYIYSSPSKLSESDQAMTTIYLNMLESFVKNNKPEVKDINWLPVSDSNILTYLYIQDPNDISLRRSKDLAEIEFWSSLPLREYEHLL